jgi:hypothetical protein
MAISRPKATRTSKSRRTEDSNAKLPPIVELTPEEAWEDYVNRAREELGVTPAEFEERWARGEYEDPPVHSAAVGIWMIRVEQPGQ